MVKEEKWVSGKGLISPESSFCGDEDTKQQLEEKSNNFNPDDYWKYHSYRLNSSMAPGQISEVKHEAPKAPKAEELYNPYAGENSARQMDETVEEFLKRLPPVTTTFMDAGPWIWIANFRKSAHIDRSIHKEDLSKLYDDGMRLLEKYKVDRASIEAQNEGKAKGTITRKLGPAREKLKQDLKNLAKTTNMTSGKWMFFPTTEELPQMWKKICQAVSDNMLGNAAKVATAEPGPRDTRLMCVYTKDFSDEEDVLRVLQGLVEIGLVDPKSNKYIYYKNDAYTYLEINSGNEYGLPASIYSSKDMLKESTKLLKKRSIADYVAGS